MMKNYLFLIIFYSSIYFYSYNSYSINSTLFNTLILNRCFNETQASFRLTNGQKYPVGNSIENLISLIEKIESEQYNLDAKTLVVMILKRFHLDGVKYFYNYDQCRIEKQRKKITEVILPEISTPEFPEKILTEDEKCNLFYTISHSIHTMKWSKDYEETPYPQEDGVASFHHDPEQAISVNKLLMGIAAGLSNATKITVHELINNLVLNSTLNVTNGKIDPIMAVTISDSLGIDSLEVIKNHETSLLSIYGIHGKWNTTDMANATNQKPIACSTSYRLLKNTSYTTIAMARGGLDGYSIGKKIQDILFMNPNIPLSQIIRMYYSQNGLSNDTGYCTRASLETELKANLVNQIQNYARVWNSLNNYLIDDSQILQTISQLEIHLFDFIKKYVIARSYDDNDFCTSPIQNDISSAPCEASSDVFIMIDVNGRINEQIAFVTQLVRYLDLRPHGGSVTVLANAHPNGSTFNKGNYSTLTYLAYRTTSSQFASCRITWFDKSSSTTITDRTELFELISRTLMDYELVKANFSGVPSKSFIGFNYNTMQSIPTDIEQRKRYDQIKWQLTHKHIDIPFFMLAYDNESVSDLVRQQEHFIPIGNNSIDYIQEKAKELAKQICKVPSIFQYNECHTSASSDRTYEGYITPGYKQYWVMYPKYFSESLSIQMKFTAEKAKIKVCYDRLQNPEMDLDNAYIRCKEAKEDNGDVIFNISNPCYNTTFENCKPLYFIVYLRSYSAKNNCIDARCKSFNQVKFTSTHSGIKCKAISSNFSDQRGSLLYIILITIGIAVLITLIAASNFYYNKRSKKQNYPMNEIEMREANQEQNPTLINVVNFHNEPSIENIDINEIRLEDEAIGRGSSGVVKKGIWSGNQVAVKIIEQFDGKEENSFNDEVKQLSRLSHPNIIKLIGVSSSPKALIMEYADGGSLYNLLHSTSIQYTHFDAINWMLQCARGVFYLHKINIIHRDLKSPNLLLVNQRRELKICDFEKARDLAENSMSNGVGTTAWMAPEVISGKHYNEKCDVYSWAIIFWEVLARKKPYENFHCREAILFAVPKGLRPQLLQNFSDQIKTLLTKSWTNDPSERPSIGEIEITMNDILSRCDAQNSEPI